MSLSYFLGRFRRANRLTPNGLGKMAGLSGAITRWEKFRFNPPPSPQQLEALAMVVGVERERNCTPLKGIVVQLLASASALMARSLLLQVVMAR